MPPACVGEKGAGGGSQGDGAVGPFSRYATPPPDVFLLSHRPPSLPPSSYTSLMYTSCSAYPLNLRLSPLLLPTLNSLRIEAAVGGLITTGGSEVEELRERESARAREREREREQERS